MKKYVPIVLLLLFLCCKQKNREVTPAFYYWKSNFNPTFYEKKKLDSLDIQTLYVKFFDIAWDANQKKALPVAKIFIRDTSYLRSKKIIPTVFITNEVFYKLDSVGVKQLALNTTSLIKKYLELYYVDSIPEVQMDCDWTATTKKKYFYFLQEIKRQNLAPHLSATIRLHQVKYTTSSGIPPVDKGLLMCYNMGTLQNIESKNSIIDSEEFEKYRSYIKTYQLPLDAGLPIFEWYVLFRNNKYAGLFQYMPTSFLEGCRKRGDAIFEVAKDTVISERLLKAGDLLRYEDCKIAAVKKVAELLSDKLPLKSLRVVLYHCDSVTLRKYTANELEDLYSSLRHY